MTEHEKLINERLDKFEKKYDDEIKSLNEKQIEIIATLAEYAPILRQLSDNVKKISENLIDKKRVEDLEEEFKKLTIVIDDLKSAPGKKALGKWNELWKTIRVTIITIIVTFFTTLVLNNLGSLLTYNVIKNNNNTEEVATK